jgi:hypothetical protein
MTTARGTSAKHENSLNVAKKARYTTILMTPLR